MNNSVDGLMSVPAKGSENKILRLLQSVILLVAFALFYQESIVHSVLKWDSAEGSHGPLILAISCYLIWLKRDDFKVLPRRPAVMPGAVIAGIGCFILFAGKLSSTISLQHISMIPTLLGFICLLRGWAYVKALFIPVVYLIFITGLVETFLSGVVIYFQLISAWIAAQLLELTGMPVLLTGTIIDLPHISLEVVRECGGISHIVSLMALSVPLAMMSRLTPSRKVVLVVASFFIGIFANGVRIASIGIYAIFNKGADLHGPNETFYVTFIFFFGMFFLVLLNQLLSKNKKAKPKTIQADAVGRENTERNEAASKSSQLSLLLTSQSVFAWVVFGILFIVTLGFIQFYKITPVQISDSLESFPTELAGFSSRNLLEMDQRLRPFAADYEVLSSYSNSSGNRIDLYFGYFSTQDRERKLIDYRRHWMHEEAQQLSVATHNGSVMINKTRLRDPVNPSNVYFWYIMDNRIITNEYVGKFYTFWNGLSKRQTNGAVILLQTQSSHEEVLPFLEELVPWLRKHLENGTRTVRL